METSEADVARSFAEWCAVMGVTSAGPFRLSRDVAGRVQIEEVGAGGDVRVVTPALAPGEFCEAVRFVQASLNLKTVMVARAVAGRKKGRG